MTMSPRRTKVTTSTNTSSSSSSSLSASSSPGEDSLEDSIHLNPVASTDDNEGIALLRQIFPEESTDALRRIHRKRLQINHSLQQGGVLSSLSFVQDQQEDEEEESVTETTNNHSFESLPPAASAAAAPSPLFTTPPCSYMTPSPVRSDNYYDIPNFLPEDFLRLPAEVAVRRYDAAQDRFRYEIVADLDRRCKEKLSVVAPLSLPQDQEDWNVLLQTRVVFRDEKVGLGLTLIEQHGQVIVYAALDYQGKEWHHRTQPPPHVLGPALKVGIAPGDVVLGLNGTLFTESQRLNRTLLRHAVETIRTAPDPVVIHFAKNDAHSSRSSSQRNAYTTPPLSSLAMMGPNTPALLDTTLHDLTIDESRLSSQDEIAFVPRTFHSTPYHEQTIGEPTCNKIMVALVAAGVVSGTKEKAFTQELLTQFSERTRQWEALSCFRVKSQPDQDLFVPLMGIRKALCVRIVHSFSTALSSPSYENTPSRLDRDTSDMMAYTIWVYDTETGREFYAPVRTFADFLDLRSAVVALQPSLKQIEFPKRKSLFGSPVRESPQRRTRQLEHFLRVLCGLLYQGTLHDSVAEIAIHVQSFLGCDAVDFNTTVEKITGTTNHSDDGDHGDWTKHTTRIRLKRSLQLYTYRLFLLPPLSEKVTQFVNHLRGRPSATKSSIEAMEAASQLKEQALTDLKQVKSFLDYLQDLILDGCMDDFVSIARREEYDAIHAVWQGAQGGVFWDRLVREAVREQVEIEVYVPLRSLLSKWLVNGWRHEDMEAHYKINELRKRPQTFFRLPSSRPPNEWMTVSNILKQGVGQSTLPCLKLRAIVDAAQEISKIFEKDRAAAASPSTVVGSHLGADQFLPIFIFCVVQAEIDRPCALSVLLRSLCDRINKIGEIGYYLASFEAAVCHIQEIDLAEEQGQQMRSFLSVNLDST